jgi:uroporphyrinogen decarboxylase
MTKSPLPASVKPLVEAALGRKPSRRPVWFMRQAGRYLPEYREVRAKTDFVTLCKTPALAAEVTLQPLRRFDLDGAIIFSDILIPATGMGQTLTFDKGEGPVLTSPVRTAADLKNLKRADAERDLGYVGEAIAKTKAGLSPTQAMIGFAGAPFTVASYMIEGSGSKNYTEVKKMMFADPVTFRGLLELIAEVTVDYLLMQAKAGADMVVLFDSWAGQLSGHDYKTQVFPVTQRLIHSVRQAGVPVAYYSGQGADRLFELGGLDVDVIAVDWRTRLSTAIRILKEQGLNPTVQGNLDPQTVMAPEATVRERVRSIVEEGRDARAHIFNVGHGLLPHTPPEALGWIVDELRR